MTALNLATATRTLDLSAGAGTVSSVAFGDEDLWDDPNTFPLTAGGPSGATILPRAVSAGAKYLYTDNNIAPADDWALFLALHNPGAITEAYDLFAAGWISVKLDVDEYDNVYIDGRTVASSLAATTAFGSGLLVLAFVGNSTETRLVSSADGTIGTGAAALGSASAASFQMPTTTSDDVAVAGMWLFDSLTVTETDAIDTIAAIEALYTAPIEASASGGWGIQGTGTPTISDTLYDLPAITTPSAGGTQTPPSAPTPATPSEMAAAGVYPLRHVYETMPAPTLVDSFPQDWTPTASGNTVYGHTQIVVEGVDVTLYDGVETPFPKWQRGEPFGSQTATIQLPQITAFHSTPAWAVHGANVSINLVKIAGGTVSLFEGFVMDVGIREDSGIFTLGCRGVLFGADMQLRPPSFNTAPQDIGTLIPALLNGASSRRWATMSQQVTGIKTAIAGGWEPLLTGYVQELLATALKDGKQWTVKCDATVPVLTLKDTTTIAWTVRAGQRGISVDLNSDASEAPNVIYGEGIAPDGGRWRNAKYPNWVADDTPDYPFDNPATTIRVGTRDADTDSGDGVSVWQAKVGRTETGVFSASDRGALKRLQRRTGITVDGILGPQSWAATFDTGANTGTLDGAFIAPLIAVEEVMPRLYGPAGDDLGANPDFDGDIVRVERKVNFGQGVDKTTGTAAAEEMLARESNPGWHGVVTFNLDPASKSRYELREGENGTIQGWRGGNINVHVASARFDEDFAILEVDTKARDYPTLQAIMTRDRDAVDPAKVARRRLLQGEVSTDSATYDAESPAGIMPKHAVFSELWDVRRIPMGAYGRIVKTNFRTSGSATPFALAVFGKSLTAADMLSLVGNPLTATSNPWVSNYDDLEDAGMLQAWGWKNQPAGYFPNTFADPDGETAASVTGRLIDDAGWDYASESSPWLWVATFAQSACYVNGRFYGAPVN